jgi:hypothetical protein
MPLMKKAHQKPRGSAIAPPTQLPTVVPTKMQSAFIADTGTKNTARGERVGGHAGKICA